MTPWQAGGVTVVVPLYRNRYTVLEAVASAVSQTRPPDEVVVVDDGSDDGSPEAVAEAFPSVRVLHQENAGPAAARNAGWREATTEWVAFLDADDTWEPEKLERQLEAASLLPGAGLVACNWSPPGSRAGPPPPPGRRARRLSGIDILLLNRFQTSTVLVRRSVLESVGGFDPMLDGTEDWELWLRCSRACEVVKLDESLVRYRDTAGSYSKDGERYRTAMRATLARELPLSGLGPRRQAEVRAWHELRLAVAFVLQRRGDLAAGSLRELHERHLLAAVPAASLRYLVPFLLRRRLRRVRPVQPLRLCPRRLPYRRYG